jgi:hypothetical protein
MDLFGIDVAVFGDAVFADPNIDAVLIRGSIFEDMVEGGCLKSRPDVPAMSSKQSGG